MLPVVPVLAVALAGACAGLVSHAWALRLLDARGLLADGKPGKAQCAGACGTLAVMFASLVVAKGLSPLMVADLATVTVLVTAAECDRHALVIPNETALAVCGIWGAYLCYYGWAHGLEQALLLLRLSLRGPVMVAVLLFTTVILMRSSLDDVGFGGGDLKLLMAAGLSCGLGLSLLMVLLACMLSALMAVLSAVWSALVDDEGSDLDDDEELGAFDDKVAGEILVKTFPMAPGIALGWWISCLVGPLVLSSWPG